MTDAAAWYIIITLGCAIGAVAGAVAGGIYGIYKSIIHKFEMILGGAFFGGWAGGTGGLLCGFVSCIATLIIFGEYIGIVQILAGAFGGIWMFRKELSDEDFAQ